MSTQSRATRTHIPHSPSAKPRWGFKTAIEGRGWTRDTPIRIETWPKDKTPGASGLHTPFGEGLVSPVLNSAEELPAVQAGREAEGVRRCGACPTPAQAAPKPLMLSQELHKVSKKQTPSPSKPLGGCFWARGISEPPPSRNEQDRGLVLVRRCRVRADVVSPPDHRNTFTVKAANTARRR